MKVVRGENGAMRNSKGEVKWRVARWRMAEMVRSRNGEEAERQDQLRV